VLLARLLCACRGLKNSQKRKPYFTIKLEKFACQARGKGARRESNSQMHKHPLWANPKTGAYASKRESRSKITTLGVYLYFRNATQCVKKIIKVINYNLIINFQKKN
jgi:hypothetical protein